MDNNANMKSTEQYQEKLTHHLLDAATKPSEYYVHRIIKATNPQNMQIEADGFNKWFLDNTESFINIDNNCRLYNEYCINPNSIPPNACFTNSVLMHAIHPELDYFEGFIFWDDMDIPLIHGWCYSLYGQIVDISTASFCRKEPEARIGVRIPREFIDELWEQNDGVETPLIHQYYHAQKG